MQSTKPQYVRATFKYTVKYDNWYASALQTIMKGIITNNKDNNFR